MRRRIRAKAASVTTADTRVRTTPQDRVDDKEPQHQVGARTLRWSLSSI